MFSRSRHSVTFAESFQNENAGAIRSNKTASSLSTYASTPSTKKRVAFVDISNRKQQSMQHIKGSKCFGTPSSRRVALGDISNKKSTKKQQSKVVKQRNGLLSTKKKKKLSTSVKQININNHKVLPTRIGCTASNNTPSIKPTMKTPFLPPVENIEFRATRPFNPFDEYNEDFDDDLKNISIYDSDEDCDKIFNLKSYEDGKAPYITSDDVAFQIDDNSLLFEDYLVDNASLKKQLLKEEQIDMSLRENIDVFGC